MYKHLVIFPCIFVIVCNFLSYVVGTIYFMGENVIFNSHGCAWGKLVTSLCIFFVARSPMKHAWESMICHLACACLQIRVGGYLPLIELMHSPSSQSKVLDYRYQNMCHEGLVWSILTWHSNYSSFWNNSSQHTNSLRWFVSTCPDVIRCGVNIFVTDPSLSAYFNLISTSASLVHIFPLSHLISMWKCTCPLSSEHPLLSSGGDKRIITIYQE